MRITTEHNYKQDKQDMLVFSCADIKFLKNWSQKDLDMDQNCNFPVLSLFCRPFWFKHILFILFYTISSAQVI